MRGRGDERVGMLRQGFGRGRGGDTCSSAFAAFRSMGREHQPFLVLPCLAARLTLMGQIAVPLSFKWARADTAVGKRHQLSPDSGCKHTLSMVEEVKG